MLLMLRHSLNVFPILKVLLSENGSTGLPELETLAGGSSGGGGGSADADDDGRADQLIITINKRQWRELVEVLEIKEAKIQDQDALRETAAGAKRKRRQL